MPHIPNSSSRLTKVPIYNCIFKGVSHQAIFALCLQIYKCLFWNFFTERRPAVLFQIRPIIDPLCNFAFANNFNSTISVNNSCGTLCFHCTIKPAAVKGGGCWRARVQKLPGGPVLRGPVRVGIPQILHKRLFLRRHGFALRPLQKRPPPGGLACILRRAQRRRPASKTVRRICRGRAWEFVPAAAVRGHIARRLFPKAVQRRLLVCAGRRTLPQGLEPLLLRGVQHRAPARCLPAQGASRRNGGLCSRADKCPEWQPKGRRQRRRPLGLISFAIPKRKRKSRQRHGAACRVSMYLVHKIGKTIRQPIDVIFVIGTFIIVSMIPIIHTFIFTFTN